VPSRGALVDFSNRLSNFASPPAKLKDFLVGFTGEAARAFSSCRFHRIFKSALREDELQKPSVGAVRGGHPKNRCF
jgi:hypothetical protein